ncbi:MAG TPA: hypothetical protein VH083_16315 [Myxococcales bacterium]|jgi:hypothetical protein|nr:hypothetical protein [Myxococcales bacterium]
MKFRVPALLCAALAMHGCGGTSGGSNSSDGGNNQQPPPPPSDLPAMTNVQSAVRVDNVSVSFDPVDGAVDYRIYPVPTGAVASIPTTNVVYRCAGQREAFPVALDSEKDFNSAFAVHSRVNSAVMGFTRTTADATLGYVWPTAGDGRVAVYSLGDPSSSGDTNCFFHRFNESRIKKYTTDSAERDTLIKQGWKDFGVAFYAVAAGTGTAQIDMAQNAAIASDRLYFLDTSTEKAARSSFTVTSAFNIMTAQATGSVPLMRVFLSNVCAKAHDELVAGQARFARAEHQGPQPMTAVLWTGITGPTTFAVEALSTPCPYQGLLSTQSFAAGVYPPGSTVAAGGVQHQAFLTPAQMQAADPFQNLYINGQGDTTAAPTPIARSFVQVSPAADAETWDFHDGFDTDPGPFTEPTENLFETRHFTSSKYEMTYINIENKQLFAAGVYNGELNVTYADSAADRTGKFRLTSLQKSSLAAGSFLHATAEVDAFSTERRYSQIIISSANAPIQSISPDVDNLASAKSVVMQNFDSWPSRVDIQACINRTWDVNGQCPRYKTDWVTDNSSSPQPPVPLLGELQSGDTRVRFDVYASTTKVYFLINGQPAACANLTAAHTLTAGPVTVTLGDVLYHSGVDIDFGSDPSQPFPGFPFRQKHEQFETHRHFDEFAFKSGVPAPTWNETLVPCATSHDCGTCTDGSCSTCVQ